MKPIPIRRLRFLTALLSTLLLLAGSVFAYPLMNAAPAAASTNASKNTDANKDEVSITLDEVTPWIDDEGTLTVQGGSSRNTTSSRMRRHSSPALLRLYRCPSDVRNRKASGAPVCDTCSMSMSSRGTLRVVYSKGPK